jgi:hypothetical protein
MNGEWRIENGELGENEDLKILHFLFSILN